MDFCISCARNSPTLDKRLYTPYLVFYSFYYSLDTSLIIDRKRKVDIEPKDENLFLYAILISLLLLSYLLY